MTFQNQDTSSDIILLICKENRPQFSFVHLLWYELQGGYYIPCLIVPAQNERPIGIWGQRHLRYIKQERKALYMELLTSGKLSTYLTDINKQATEQMLLLIKQMAEREGVTEQLKAQDQMLWVQRMNNICARAMEIVNHDLIYA